MNKCYVKQANLNLITHEVPSSLRQGLVNLEVGESQGGVTEFMYYDIISKIKNGVPRWLNRLNV